MTLPTWAHYIIAVVGIPVVVVVAMNVVLSFREWRDRRRYKWFTPTPDPDEPTGGLAGPADDAGTDA
jgi:hypothetical protein